MPAASFKESVVVSPVKCALPGSAQAEVCVALFFSEEQRPLVLSPEMAVELFEEAFKLLREERDNIELDIAELLQELRESDIRKHDSSLSDGVFFDFVGLEAGTYSERHRTPEQSFEKVLLLSFETRVKKILLDIGLAVAAIAELLKGIFSSLLVVPGREAQMASIVEVLEAQYV